MIPHEALGSQLARTACCLARCEIKVRLGRPGLITSFPLREMFNSGIWLANIDQIRAWNGDKERPARWFPEHPCCLGTKAPSNLAAAWHQTSSTFSQGMLRGSRNYFRAVLKVPVGEDADSGGGGGAYAGKGL